MPLHATGLKRGLALSLLLIVAGAGRLAAQAPDSPIVFASPSAITSTLVDPPNVGRSESGGGSDNTQWLKVEWHYAATPKASPYIDAVEFRVWVEGRDLSAPEATNADGVPVALTGSVTYVNLPEMRDAYGVVYVHPSTLLRYGSKAGTSDFTEKFNVHVEAYVGGAKMDLFDKNKAQDPAWYTNLRAVTGLLYRQDQCPFLVNDSGRYPQLKPLPSPQ